MMKHSSIISHLKLIASDVVPVGAAKIAAAIVYKGRIISIGICSYKSHPLQRKYGRNEHSIFLHAEIDAISKAIGRVDLSKCSLYVVRMKWDGCKRTSLIEGLAKPCEGCCKAIAAFGIRNVYWTKENDG